MAEIIIRKVLVKGRNILEIECPWCKRQVRIVLGASRNCPCGALHRWNGASVHHIPGPSPEKR